MNTLVFLVQRTLFNFLLSLRSASIFSSIDLMMPLTARFRFSASFISSSVFFGAYFGNEFLNVASIIEEFFAFVIDAP